MTSLFPPERYAGKPFLVFVDCWLLDCIGELDDESRVRMEAMTPRLRGIYDHKGSWQDIVRSQLDYSTDVEPAIRELWVKNRDVARQGGVEFTPAQFVEMFVEENIST